VGRGVALLFHDRDTKRGEWSAARPGRTLPLGKTRYPFYRRLGGPQGRYGRAENLVPTGIRFRTVHSVAIPTELPGPPYIILHQLKIKIQVIPYCYATQVTRKGEIRNALVGRLEGRSGVRWEDNIKTGVT